MSISQTSSASTFVALGIQGDYRIAGRSTRLSSPASMTC